MSEFIVQFGIADASNAQITVYPGESGIEPKSVHRFLHSAFTYYDQSRKYSWEVMHHVRGADCNVRFYDFNHGRIPIGMIPRARDYLYLQYGDRCGISITKEVRAMYSPPEGKKVTREEIEEFAESLDIHERESGKKLTPYEHQYKLVEMALNRRRCSLFACTSSGKSVSIMIIARYLVEKEHRKVLVIVPSSGLVEQLYSNFYDDYGWDDAKEHCTLIHGTSCDKLSKKQLDALKAKSIGEETLLKDITISTWQSLQRKHDDYFKVFDAVIVDEAHGTRGIVLRTILEKCSNANNFKIGVSGTLPQAKPGKENRGADGSVGLNNASLNIADSSEFIDACNIESQLGPVYDVIHLRELIAKGILTPARINMIYIPYPMSVRYSICYAKYPTERALTTGNSSRKSVISMLIDSGKHLTRDQNTVILYDGIERLHDLHDFLKEKYPEYKYYIIEGEVSAAKREEIRHILEESTGNILVATYGCMKQGVNIKLLNNLVFAEPAKSMYKVMQSIGRVVRKHPDKKIAMVYDLVDDANCWRKSHTGPVQMFNYMMRHARFRMSYYAEENLPIEEIHLDGIYEADLTPEDVKKHRQKAADKAAEKVRKEREAAEKRRNVPSYVPKFSII